MVSLVDSPLNVVCSCHRVEICTGLVGVSRVQLRLKNIQVINKTTKKHY